MADFRPTRFILETEDQFILVAEGTMDWSVVTGPPNALVIPQLPGILRDLAERHESAMTTGTEFPE